MLVSTRINRNHLRATLITAAKNDVRYYLNGLLIEIYLDRLFIVSTDGNRLSVLRDDSNPGVEVPEGGTAFVMPRTLAETIKAEKRLPTVGLTFDTETKIITLNDYGSASSAKAVDGVFPDWRRVLPTNPSGEAANFNPEFVGDLAKIAKALGCAVTSPIIWHGGSSAALVTITNAPEFVGVMVPFEITTARPSLTGFTDACVNAFADAA